MHIYLKFETYNFQSKNLAHKGVDFYVQNALKLAYEHLSVIPKNFPGVIPPHPREGERRGGEEKRGERRGRSRGRRVASWVLGG